MTQNGILLEPSNDGPEDLTNDKIANLEEQLHTKRALKKLNGRLRDECLNEHLFANLRHARDLIAAWRDDYNHHRPHTSLDGLTPWEYHQRSVEDQTLNRAN